MSIVRQMNDQQLTTYLKLYEERWELDSMQDGYVKIVQRDEQLPNDKHPKVVVKQAVILSNGQVVFA